MTTTHTPGPWCLQESLNDFYGQEIIGGRRIIAETCIDDAVQETEEDLANARLIAAAPDLLSALEYFYNIMHDYRDSTRKGYVKQAFKRARDAITKATRESNDPLITRPKE